MVRRSSPARSASCCWVRCPRSTRSTTPSVLLSRTCSARSGTRCRPSRAREGSSGPLLMPTTVPQPVRCASTLHVRVGLPGAARAEALRGPPGPLCVTGGAGAPAGAGSGRRGTSGAAPRRAVARTTPRARPASRPAGCAQGARESPLRSCQRPFLEGFRRSAPVLGSLAADSVTGRHRVAEKSVTAICAGQGHFRAPPLRSYRLLPEDSL